MRLLLSICPYLLVPLAHGLPSVPSTPFWFQQKVSHFSASNATYWQRYYLNEAHWAGPGSPIFVIMGGEGGISPETGIFYPWVTDVLAKEYRGLVIQPEHRFYGESLPFGNASYLPTNMRAAARKGSSVGSKCRESLCNSLIQLFSIDFLKSQKNVHYSILMHYI